MIVKNLTRSLWTIGWLAGVMWLMVGSYSTVQAQDEEALPEPITVQLESKDGVALTAEFYPGTFEKETVPVILLHNWTEDRKSMLPIAATLQEQHGYAVIVPDLRGHGDSNKTVTGEDLDRDRWRANELTAVMEDVETCKNYLIAENNKGNLNIDTLAIVAEGPTTIIAANWTLRDWSFAPLGSIKQGQDAKALVLLNPERNFKGLNGNDAWQNPLFTGRSGGAFPILIASERDQSRDAKNIFDRMMRGRKNLEISDKAIESVRFQIEQQRRVVKSRNKGDKLVAQIIGDFIQKQVFERRHEFRWAVRRAK